MPLSWIAGHPGIAKEPWRLPAIDREHDLGPHCVADSRAATDSNTAESRTEHRDRMPYSAEPRCTPNGIVVSESPPPSPGSQRSGARDTIEGGAPHDVELSRRRVPVQCEAVAPLRPDVLVVQEVERLDQVLVFAGSHQPTFRDRLSRTRDAKRSIAVLSYTDMKLEAVDHDDPMYTFRRFRAERNGLSFQVVAVWTEPADARRDDYKQAIEGVQRFRDWIQRAPTVIMGDFNDSARYQTTNWPELMAAIEPLEVASAYHAFTGEPLGQEIHLTYFHGGKADGFAAHLDYCFIPLAWVPRITAVTVGDHQEWSRSSDHMPLVVDLDL